MVDRVIVITSRKYGKPNLIWRGDISRPPHEILCECKTLLENTYNCNYIPNDDYLKSLIDQAKKMEKLKKEIGEENGENGKD